ncbi:MAG: molybdopterin oxidoreductase family protein [Thermoanaerobacterales bacterium]|jgi:anaerobic selenocysteine-containing dehydrogenase|nr:molybdopterin oxidoreductase family protein [Thermoanaerobacterales bacterium]
MTTTATRTAFRTCPLCEAGCGLEIALAGPPGEEVVTRIRGDRADVFSHGFICPKGSTLKHLHEDPDWLRRPRVRRGGRLVEVDWAEAFAEVERRLPPIVQEHGRDAVAVYIGNPTAHSLGALLFVRPLVRALGTTNVYSASTVDQRPKEVAAGLMFGTSLSVPVPDVDRTDFLLMLGANPYASNGSLATAPDWPGRIEALRARGGTLVVVDPRRTRTAEAADRHLAIRPGADPYLLMALVNVVVTEGLVDLGPAGPYVRGVDTVVEVCRPFTPEATAVQTGLDPSEVRRLARDLAAAPRACVYGRIGTTVAPFGTLSSWLVDVLNTLTGNLDRPGGAMFATAAAGAANTRGTPRYGRGVRLHRRRSRVRGLGETMGELPVVCLAEEIDTPGEGQVRALVTIAGNPVLSTPNGARLDAALAGLDLYVAVDPYVNETTRHADVILPPPTPLQKSHYDLALLQLAVRNVANYSPPVLPRAPGQPDEWEILARLALIAQGMGAGADPALVDDLVLRSLVESAVADETSPIAGRDPDEVVAALGDRRGPERILDLMLRVGPYGEGFGARPDGLSLDVLLANPHGVDLGPLRPRLPEVLRTPSGMVELAPEPIVADVERLLAGLDAPVGGLRLIGRRDLRSNNSWMHNVEVLVKGRPRCTLQVHPDDAARLGLTDGAPAEVTSRTGKITVPVEVTDAIRPGVVSIPHGWGHDLDGVELRVARAHAGVNTNLLADDELIDPLSGTAVLNGIPVEVAPAGG